jgi:hypothetical protein
VSATGSGGGTSPLRKRSDDPLTKPPRASVNVVPSFGQFALLQFQRPGDEVLRPVAILLLDSSTDKLYIRGLENYTGIADENDAQVIAFTVKQFQADAETEGGNAMRTQLEATLSNSIQLTDRIPLEVREFPATLDRLFNAFFP